MPISRHDVGPRMSQVVTYGSTVYFAGQVADDPSDATVAGQTKQILDKIEKKLAMIGSDKTRILSATIWLSDIATFDDMNQVWDAWVTQGHTPARACVEAKLARPDFLVEIAVIAAC
jgi:enamine deaminase RidA (YjgF/YER057c/UK114 family)